jgi:hypothetical protein
MITHARDLTTVAAGNPSPGPVITGASHKDNQHQRGALT